MLRLFLAAVLLAPAALGQAAYDVTLPMAGLDGDARDAFERGVELLHSFEYDDARDAFRQSQRLAPSAAMAYWGEAMTYNHPVWQQQDAAAAAAVLARLTEHASGPASRHEASYRAALGVLFSDTSDETKEVRDDAYLAAMAAHAAAFPDDRDGRAFYALALLGSAHEGRDYAVYGRAAEVAQSVLDQDPEHPGALHYLIHAYDDPDHAALALPAARAYAEIVSAASHALHMPTHIYFALGLWDDASALNVRSFEAARAASARRGEPLNNHGWHALYWLNYSELQRGHDAEAVALLARADSLYRVGPSDLAFRHLVRIRHQTLITLAFANREVRLSTSELRLERPLGDADPTTEALDLASRMILGVAADAAETRLQALAAAPGASATVRALAAVMLSGLVTDTTALERLAEAVDAVEATPIAFGPPTPAMYPHERMAGNLAAAGAPALARCLLDAVEARAPGRRLTALMRDQIGAPRPDDLGVDLPTPAVCARPD